MAKRREAAPLRGDEDALFARYDDALQKATARAVNTSKENIEDACAFAWSRLLITQPRRESVYAWLKTVARHEAIRIDRETRSMSPSEVTALAESLGDRKDPIAGRIAMLDGRRRLQAAESRERRVMVLCGVGYSYAQVAEALGISYTRVNQLISSGRARMTASDRAAELATPAAHPRARLLDELLRHPPPFLRAEIGRPPVAATREAPTDKRLEWSRLALAIIDFRVAHGITDAARALGRNEQSAEFERSSLEARIARYNEGREGSRRNSREIDR